MPIKSTDQKAWLAFFSLAWISICGLLWLTFGGPAWLPILIVLIFIGIGISAGHLPFRRTPFDLALLLFWLTALVGVWTAYARDGAWEKFWLLTLAILVFYAIASQPTQNFWLLSGLLGFLGALLSLNFLFVYDWRTLPADFRVITRLGLAWMAVRPALPGQALTPNITAGILAGFFPFTLALGMAAWQNKKSLKYPWLPMACALSCAGLMALTIFMTSSRGAWMALAVGLGFWLVWGLGEKLLAGVTGRWKLAIILCGATAGILACGVILALIGDPGRILELAPGLPTGQSRLRIDTLTLRLIGDFPFTGGGLKAFAGLFSWYMLVIPSVLFRYGHNLYLDVALEQGLMGLLLLLGILVGSAVLLVRRPAADSRQPGLNLLRQATLCSLVVMVIHGIIDDPFYGVKGTPFLWVVAGLAVFIQPSARAVQDLVPETISRWKGSPVVRRWALPMVGLVVLAIAVYGAMAWKQTAALGLANLGAVRMAQVQLSEFPTNEWNDRQDVGALAGAQRFFEQALSLDPTNRTANHRLGLIAMLRQDYPSAIGYLDAALRRDPGHRGVVKNLGYVYVWAGHYDKAQALLVNVPEAKRELRVYSWWWATHGRADLAQNAEQMIHRLAILDSLHYRVSYISSKPRSAKPVG